jgi:hypothetical protein
MRPETSELSQPNVKNLVLSVALAGPRAPSQEKMLQDKLLILFARSVPNAFKNALMLINKRLLDQNRN